MKVESQRWGPDVVEELLMSRCCRRQECQQEKTIEINCVERVKTVRPQEGAEGRWYKIRGVMRFMIRSRPKERAEEEAGGRGRKKRSRRETIRGKIWRERQGQRLRDWERGRD